MAKYKLLVGIHQSKGPDGKLVNYKQGAVVVTEKDLVKICGPDKFRLIHGGEEEVEPTQVVTPTGEDDGPQEESGEVTSEVHATVKKGRR